MRLLAFLLLFEIGGLAACTDVAPPAPAATDTTAVARAPVPLPARFQGVTFDSRRPPPPGTLRRFHDFGATHLTLIPYAWMPEAAEPRVRFDPDHDGWYTESVAGIRALHAEAQTLGMTLILKPQIWIGHYSATTVNTMTMGFETEADWQAWEADYRTFILFWAGLSQELELPLFVIGTELSRAARERPAFWRQLAADVREVYPGPITYAANWHDDFETLTWWDAVDAIAVQAYFPLSDAADPPLDRLRAGWQRPLALIRQVQQRYDRPVLFTELGYRSASSAAARPWQWPEADPAPLPPDEPLQARLYDAFFQTFWPEPWFAGCLIWKVYPDLDPVAHATDFTPQGKQAEAVVRQWFKMGKG